MSLSLRKKIEGLVKILQHFVNRIWYPPLVGFLALIDSFILIVPTDGILISSTMLTPKRWIWLAILTTVGSTAGSMLLASVVELHGLPWVLEHYPGIDQSKAWIWTVGLFVKYGLALVFLVAVSPLIQQPAIILAALANVPLAQLLAVVLLGRIIKFLIMAYVASHAPKYLSKMWGLKGELKDVGIRTP